MRWSRSFTRVHDTAKRQKHTRSWGIVDRAAAGGLSDKIVGGADGGADGAVADLIAVIRIEMRKAAIRYGSADFALAVKDAGAGTAGQAAPEVSVRGRKVEHV
jgi:hypothetical protein